MGHFCPSESGSRSGFWIHGGRGEVVQSRVAEPDLNPHGSALFWEAESGSGSSSISSLKSKFKSFRCLKREPLCMSCGRLTMEVWRLLLSPVGSVNQGSPFRNTFMSRIQIWIGIKVKCWTRIALKWKDRSALKWCVSATLVRSKSNEAMKAVLRIRNRICKDPKLLAGSGSETNL